MIIGIYDNKTIRDIQLEFSEGYPNLKIEFYVQPLKSGEDPAGKKLHPINYTLGDIKTTPAPGFFEIRPGSTTAEIEAAFEQHFGLSIRVSRLRQQLWELIPDGSGLSLEEQNNKSYLLSH